MFVTKKKYKELEKNHFILQKAFLELKEEMMKAKKKVKKNDKSKFKN